MTVCCDGSQKLTPNILNINQRCEPDPCDLTNVGDLVEGDAVKVCQDGEEVLKGYVEPDLPCEAPAGGDLVEGDPVLVCGPGGLEQKPYVEPDLPCEAPTGGDLVEGDPVLVCGPGGLTQKPYVSPDSCESPNGGVYQEGDGIVACREGDEVLISLPVPDEPCSTRVRAEDNDPVIEVVEEESCGDCCGYVVSSKCPPLDTSPVSEGDLIWTCDDGQPKLQPFPEACCPDITASAVGGAGGTCFDIPIGRTLWDSRVDPLHAGSPYEYVFNYTNTSDVTKYIQFNVRYFISRYQPTAGTRGQVFFGFGEASQAATLGTLGSELTPYQYNKLGYSIHDLVDDDVFPWFYDWSGHAAWGYGNIKSYIADGLALQIKVAPGESIDYRGFFMVGYISATSATESFHGGMFFQYQIFDGGS